MQVLADFLPILIFFIVYKWVGIFAATLAAIIISLIQVIFYRLKYGRFSVLQMITFSMILVLGGATLLSHNTLFIKWKVTAVNWILAIVLLISQGLKKPLLKLWLGSQFALSDVIWNKLNISWVIFLASVGALNLYVAYHFDTEIWVNFKLFGVLGLSLLFIIAQSLFLAKYLNEKN